MQGKFWSFVLVLGLAVFSTMLYFLFNADNEQISAQEVAGQNSEVVIYITDKGFNPENVTIRRGTLVKWVNRDIDPHNVAFSLKTNLDNLTVVNQQLLSGETLTYKFEVIGEYSYFDKIGGLVGKVDVK